ncbi:hypothetical protein F511_07467 [Dorcoceras hygrometricum]|uniref:UDP-glycosyltransferase 83A1-like n=1 Tax=Dorcoceras hygrometricum TaxID=472368 RepID=A0A2Z7CDP3_9LAMI|nr:hypothetical protein F511_07467 [Dorcoceras hygrometricum]
MGNPHVIAIPYPAQGHVIPSMECSLWLVKNGIKVTLVNTEFNHKRVVESLQESEKIRGTINMVCIPDGLEPWEDRNDLGKLTLGITRVMPGELEALIRRINESEVDEITCVLADCGLGWALEVAERIGLRKKALFWPAAAAVLALSFNLPKLVDDGVIDNDGRPLKNEMVELSPTIPLMNPSSFIWTCIGDQTTQKIVFDVLVKTNQAVKLADWLICNSSHDLEPGAFSLFPNISPVGPLLARNRLGKSVGYFWPEDSSCLTWLDQQAANSVIYVAFGSFTVFDQTQFVELALGLELTNMPFLWVVREDTVAGAEKAYPKGFKQTVQGQGHTVTWAPQQQVLSHPSIACFVSHCGWNSTVEGLSNGVPFLCWPYFADQFLNQDYICDKWEIELRLDKDESGIIRSGEIENKIQLLLNGGIYKERALNLQARAMDSATQGISRNNFNNFIEWIKED